MRGSPEACPKRKPHPLAQPHQPAHRPNQRHTQSPRRSPHDERPSSPPQLPPAHAAAADNAPHAAAASALTRFIIVHVNCYAVTQPNDAAGQPEGSKPYLATAPQAVASPAADSQDYAKHNLIQIPTINLPKGGGALKSIDEKFQVNGANGTASLNLTIPVSKSRSDFAPSLSLQYNSGAGNSPFGIGWNIDLHSIRRRTDKLLPQYQDASNSDIFQLSGVEDLVLQLAENATHQWLPVSAQKGNYYVKVFRPRMESAFTLIEQVTSTTGMYWKTTSKENVVTFYGLTPQSRVADPADATHIFEWLPEISYDDKGNCIQFFYVAENLTNVPPLLHEGNRLNGNQRNYPRNTDAKGLPTNDSRFIDNAAMTQYISTSSGVNDSGLFEVNFRDERYIPFEGAGAVSSWQIQLPSVFAQFDPATITDLIIELKYTSREGGPSLQAVASQSLQNKLSSATSSGLTLMRGFSARRDYPTQWYKFLNPPTAADPQQLVMDLTSRFPFFTQGSTIKITNVIVLADLPSGATVPVLTISGTKISNVPVNLGPDPEYGNFQYATFPCKDTIGQWTISNAAGGGTPIPANGINDLYVIFTYAL
jgi:hypothetical protein